MPDVSKLLIINNARAAVGEETVTDLTPIDAMMRAALAAYDDIVDEEIEYGEWRFALKFGTPTLTDTNLNRTLPYKWEIPSESMGLVTVRYLDQVLDGALFEIRQNFVFTIYATDVTLSYRFRPDEALWPRRFSSIISTRLEALFLRGRDFHSEATSRDQEVFRRRTIGRNAESRQRHDRPMDPGSIIMRRLGVSRFSIPISTGGGGGGGGGGGTAFGGYRQVTAGMADTITVTAEDNFGVIDVDMSGAANDKALVFDVASLPDLDVWVTRNDSGALSGKEVSINSGALVPLTADGNRVHLKSGGGRLIELERV